MNANAELGTYRYWCMELVAFLRLCDGRELSLSESEIALKALAHVWTRTEEPTDLGDRVNFHQGFNIALRKCGVEAEGLPAQLMADLGIASDGK